MRDGWRRWLNPGGEPWPTPRELAEHERQHAEQERQRAEQAETLLAQYQRHFGALPEGEGKADSSAG